MFRAIMSGKAGRLPIAIAQGEPWLGVFKQSEDLLTATVFERLAYLDGSLLWSILRDTFGPVIPNYRIAELLNIEFWPRWNDTVELGTVEPDILMQFSVGDPAKRVDLIIEAKLGGLQYAEQWQRQWESYQHYLGDGKDEDTAQMVLLLAIGGLKGGSKSTVDRLSQQLRISPLATEVLAAAADWARLASVMSEVTAGSPPSQRIVSDVVEALALFGYRHLRSLDTVGHVEAPRDAAHSLEFIRGLESLKTT